MSKKWSLLLLLFSIGTLSGYAQSKIPVASIAGITGEGKVFKDSLLTIKKIDASTPFVIVKYTMTYLSDGTLKEFNVNGNYISEEMRKTIKTCKIADRMFFEDILATDKEGVIYKLSAFSITVK